MLDFASTASLVGLGEKLSMDSRIGQSVCCRLCRELFFLEQWLCSTLLMTMQMVAIWVLCEIHMVLKHTWTERGKRVVCWSGFPLQGVHRFESP
jgi:hypothetical protein